MASRRASPTDSRSQAFVGIGRTNSMPELPATGQAGSDGRFTIEWRIKDIEPGGRNRPPHPISGFVQLLTSAPNWLLACGIAFGAAARVSTLSNARPGLEFRGSAVAMTFASGEPSATIPAIERIAHPTSNSIVVTPSSPCVLRCPSAPGCSFARNSSAVVGGPCHSSFSIASRSHPSTISLPFTRMGRRIRLGCLAIIRMAS